MKIGNNSKSRHTKIIIQIECANNGTNSKKIMIKLFNNRENDNENNRSSNKNHIMIILIMMTY